MSGIILLLLIVPFGRRSFSIVLFSSSLVAKDSSSEPSAPNRLSQVKLVSFYRQRGQVAKEEIRTLSILARSFASPVDFSDCSRSCERPQTPPYSVRPILCRCRLNLSPSDASTSRSTISLRGTGTLSKCSRKKETESNTEWRSAAGVTGIERSRDRENLSKTGVPSLEYVEGAKERDTMRIGVVRPASYL